MASGFSPYFEPLADSTYADKMPSNPQMPLSDFMKSEAAPEALALIFEASFERSAETLEQKEERSEAAKDWYEYFKDFE